jgi:DNA-binding MarR family transcriptional regulator
MLTEDEGRYQRLLQALHRADLLSRRSADQQLLAQIGVGRAMFLVLEALADAGSGQTSQQDIADQLGLTKAAVSRHIATGRDQGYLRAEATPGSRRQNSVVLTAEGRRLVERGRRHRGHAERAAVAELGAEELEQAARTLEALCQVLDGSLRHHPARKG